jgi:hypothetical protein
VIKQNIDTITINDQSREFRWIEIVVSPAPMNINRLRRSHWAVVAKEARRIHDEVAWQLIASRGNLLKPNGALVQINYLRWAWNKMDPTGVIESGKAVIDGLVHGGWLDNDTEKQVKVGTVRQWIDRKNPSSLRLHLRWEEKRRLE